MRPALLLAPVILFSCTGQPAVQEQKVTDIDSVGTRGNILFDALLGDWQDTLDSTGTMFHEQWRKDPDGTYTGLGFVLSGNDTVFIEHLKILECMTSRSASFTPPAQRMTGTCVFPALQRASSPWTGTTSRGGKRDPLQPATDVRPLVGPCT
jgi:hypothetical protein